MSGAIKKTTSSPAYMFDRPKAPTSTAPVQQELKQRRLSQKASAVNTGVDTTKNNNPKLITKDKMREIIQNAPEGTSPAGIVASLRAKGFELEGYKESVKQGNIKRQQQEKKETEKRKEGFSLAKLGKRHIQDPIESAIQKSPIGTSPLAYLPTQIIGAGQQMVETIGKEAIKAVPRVALSGAEAITGKEQRATLPYIGEVRGVSAMAGDRAAMFAGEEGILGKQVSPEIATGLGITLSVAEQILDAVGVGEIATQVAKRLRVPISTVNDVVKFAKEPKLPKMEMPFTKGEGVIGRGARNIERGVEAKKVLKAKSISVQRATKLGIPEVEADIIKQSSKQEKIMYKKVLNSYEEMAKNPLSKNRPENIIGEDIITKRIKPIQKHATQSGIKLQKIAEKFPDTLIDVSNTRGIFMDDMAKLNVGMSPDGELKYVGSVIEGDKSYQKILNRIWRDLGTEITAKQAHIIRQRVFDELGKAARKLKLNKMEGAAAANVRSSLIDDIGTVAPKYREEATKFAIDEKTLTDFFDTIGKKWRNRPEDALNLRAGEVSNRLGGRAAGEIQFQLNKLDEVAKSIGIEDLTDTYKSVRFKDFLEEQMGIQQKGGFAGQSALGTQKGIEAVTDVATGGKSAILRAFKKAGEFATQISPEEKARAIRNLLDDVDAKTISDLVKPLKKTKGEIPLNIIDDLVGQVKKYKSADEFVASVSKTEAPKNTIVYRGGDKSGNWWSFNKDAADTYAGFDTTKVFTKDISGMKFKKVTAKDTTQGAYVNRFNKALEKAIKQGYDGIVDEAGSIILKKK